MRCGGSGSSEASCCSLCTISTPTCDSRLHYDMENRDQWIIIGISGVTCGGKTSLASMLLRRVRPTYVFNQDQYFLPDDSARHVPVPGLTHNNYDVLSALDMDAMMRDISLTLCGAEPAHRSETRAAQGALQLRKKLLVLEGFTALNYPPINDMCDLRYYFVLEYGECYRRRAQRCYDPPDVPGYFEQCVWPEHLRYRAQIEQDSRVKILDGTDPDVIDIVLADLLAIAPHT